MAQSTELRTLRELLSPHSRRDASLFVAQGSRTILSLIEGEMRPQFLYVKEGHEAAFLPEHGALPRSEAFFKKATLQPSSPDSMAIFPTPPPANIRTEGCLTLALADIQNPLNVGAICRTADWFGVHQLVCSPQCARLYSPKAIQASMGAAAHALCLYTDLEGWMASLPPNTPIFCADAKGSPITPASHLPNEGVLVLGNEGQGVPPAIAALATHRVAIPAVGRPATDSLNVAASAAILIALLTLAPQP